MRNRTSDLILDTAPLGTPIPGVTTIGKALVIAPDCDDLHLVFRLEASVATLATSNITIFLPGIVDDVAAASNPALLVAGNVVPTTVVPGTIVLGTNATWTFTNPATGITQWAARILYPPPTVQPVFTFGAGGGNIRLRVKAVY